MARPIQTPAWPGVKEPLMQPLNQGLALLVVLLLCSLHHCLPALVQLLIAVQQSLQLAVPTVPSAPNLQLWQIRHRLRMGVFALWSSSLSV